MWTDTLRVLSDGTRLRVIQLLLTRSYCVRALAYKLKISEPAISQHLRILTDAGLTTGVQRGRYVHYEVVREKLTEASQMLSELAQTERTLCWPSHGGCDEAENVRCPRYLRSLKEKEGKTDG